MYELDNAGNRTKITYMDGSYTRWDLDSAYRLIGETHHDSGGIATSTIGYTYDPRGHLATANESGTTTTYDYSDRGYLTQVTSGVDTTTYTIDHAGRRASETVDGTITTDFLWDEFSTYGDVILEADGTGGIAKRYLIGEELIGQVRSTPQSEVRFYLEDALGSTRLLVNNIGTITETFEYDAYGQLTAGDASRTAYLYTGQRHDAMTGCVHLRARQYDPSLGRFMGMDTWPLDYDYPVELNRYVYATGNPATYVDPSGYSIFERISIQIRSTAIGNAISKVGLRSTVWFNQVYIRLIEVSPALQQTVCLALGLFSDAALGPGCDVPFDLPAHWMDIFEPVQDYLSFARKSRPSNQPMGRFTPDQVALQQLVGRLSSTWGLRF